MSLFLSRICLNPLFAPALRLAADPYDMHCRLLQTLPRQEQPRSSEDPRGLLFRVDASDTGPIVLVQTAVEPDWNAWATEKRLLRREPETKRFEPRFRTGQRLGFRLFCKPSIRKSGDFGMRPNGKRKTGPRITCRDDEERMEWLRWKGGDCGFTVESVGLTLFSVPAIKSGKPPREAGGSFSAVRFDGVLLVTDPEKLLDAVRNGIGTQKAFGFGLLSLAAIDE